MHDVCLKMQAEREEAMENLENLNAYLVLKMNNGIKS